MSFADQLKGWPFKRATPDATAFSEDVARTNNDLVEGYRSIRNRL